MVKKKHHPPQLPEPVQTTTYRHNRGVIKDNAVQALLHDRLFRQRIEKKRKGKGSYRRKAKHTGKWFEKPDYQIFDDRNLIIGFFFASATRHSYIGLEHRCSIYIRNKTMLKSTALLSNREYCLNFQVIPPPPIVS